MNDWLLSSYPHGSRRENRRIRLAQRDLELREQRERDWGRRHQILPFL